MEHKRTEKKIKIQECKTENSGSKKRKGLEKQRKIDGIGTEPEQKKTVAAASISSSNDNLGGGRCSEKRERMLGFCDGSENRERVGKCV